MKTTVIFDLDGLLSDTEKLHRLAYREVLGGIGVELTDEMYAEHWIRLGRGIGDFIREHKLDVSADVVRVKKADCYRKLVEKQAEPMPGAVELLKKLKGVKRLALASSSYSDAIEAVTKAIGIVQYFEVMVSGNDVKKTKPHPDIFLLAAQRLGVPPAECVVLEDAEKGVIAANAAGMKCIAVPNVHTAGHDFSKAARVVRSLEDVSVAMIDAL